MVIVGNSIDMRFLQKANPINLAYLRAFDSLKILINAISDYHQKHKANTVMNIIAEVLKGFFKPPT